MVTDDTDRKIGKGKSAYEEALRLMREGAAELRRSAGVLDRTVDHLERELKDDREHGK